MRLVPLLVIAAFLPVLAALSTGCKDSGATSAQGAGSAPTAEATDEVKDVTLPGIDTSAMTPRERHEFSRLATQLLAPCANVPVPVASCVLEKRPCGPCAQAAKFIAHAVRAGAPGSDIEHAYKERFDPGSVKTLPLSGSPTKGPDDAPVTLVEFADFECPHCRAAVPMIDAVVAAHPDKIRVVYKFVSLHMHVRAEPAARAAWAAGQQGKFWEMEHLLFERQDHLEDADLERYAQMLKLDMPRWHADFSSPAAAARMAEDRKLEDDLKLVGTPTVYVNGREVNFEADESIEDRVASELGVTATPAASASAPPPAAPSASTASASASAAPSASNKPH